MIDKSNGKFTAVCDCCFERSEEYNTYNEMRHGIAYEGWHCHYNEDEQAVKKDNGKPMLNLVPLDILYPLALVREFAVSKYGMDGIEAWREISDDRLLAALLRHTVAYQKDHDARDEESGLPAIYHVAINAAFLAIKTMERFNERWEMADVVAETKQAFSRCDEDWSEGE